MVRDEAYLIIPVYNEVGVIRQVLEGALQSFPKIVCVDDGSHDGSGSEIAKTKAHLVTHPINLGQGAALQTGLEYALRDAKAKYFVTFDADGQHRAEDALAMVEEAQSGKYDVILGSRFLRQQESLPKAKRLLLTFATQFSNAISGTQLTDTHNGLRVFSRRFAEKIEITMPDMPHATEIVILVGRSGMKYKEMPVTIDYTEYSKAKGQSIWNSINILFDVLLHQVFGRKR